MKRQVSYTILALLVFFVYDGLAQESPDYFSPKNILRFADSLYDEGDFLRAAAEYQRYISYYSPDKAEVERIYFRMALCYRLGGQEKMALSYFQKIGDTSESEFRDRALLQSALSLFSLGEYRRAENALSQWNISGDADPEIFLKKEALTGASLIMQSRWQEAHTYLVSVNEEHGDPLTESLKTISSKGLKSPYKSRFLAGFLSAVIPGLGKVYAKKPLDGIYSFFTIGLAGWQAYDGFHKDGISSFKGWAFGVIGSVLYLGNIYGSAVSVQIYNIQIKDKLFEEVRFLVRASF